MRNILKYKQLTFLALIILFLITIILAILTYMMRNNPIDNPLFMFAMRHHLTIMIAMTVIAAAFGFFWAQISTSQEKDTRKMRSIFYKLLSPEEKQILKYLLEHKQVTQAQLSHIQGMTRLKVFRTIKKLEEKDFITVTSEGKIRRIQINKEIDQLL